MIGFILLKRLKTNDERLLTVTFLNPQLNLAVSCMTWTIVVSFFVGFNLLREEFVDNIENTVNHQPYS